MREEMIMRTHKDEFSHLMSVGFSKDQALKKIKGSKMSSVQLLQKRYEMDKEKPGVIGISLQGIKRTSIVDRWIDKMENEGKIIDRGYVLEFPVGGR